MTALERALVVYAEAKGYEIEVEYRLGFWKNKQYEGKFDFGQCEYQIKNREDYRKVYDELSDSFKPLCSPEQTSKLLSDMERVKHKPAGFPCKTVTLSREEIEKMTAEEQALEFQANAMRYELDKLIDPEQEEREKEVHPIIEILEAYKGGERIELKEKYSDHAWSELWKGHIWDFSDFNYRIAPKQPEAIPATEEELKMINRTIYWTKHKDTGHTSYRYVKSAIEPNNEFVFNPDTKCWEDWDEK